MSLEVRTLYDPQDPANRYPKMLYKPGQKKSGTVVNSQKEETALLETWAAEAPKEEAPVEVKVEDKKAVKASKAA